MTTFTSNYQNLSDVKQDLISIKYGMVFEICFYDLKLIKKDKFFDQAHISLKLRLNKARKVVIKLLKLQLMNTDEKIYIELIQNLTLLK